MNKILLAIILAFFLTGCLITEWEDVSQEHEFQSLIGLTYKTKVDFAIHGVTMEENYEEILDHYDIMKAPGFKGREVLSKEILPVGTEFQLLKVVRCVDCPFKQEKFMIKILSSNKFKDVPITFLYNQFKIGKGKHFELTE